MPKFVFAYHGGKTSMTPEEGQAHMMNWRQWVESLGAAMIDPGHAVGASVTVRTGGVEDNGGANPISGVSVVEAETLAEAVSMAQRSPHISIGGSIEVAEVLNIEM